MCQLEKLELGRFDGHEVVEMAVIQVHSDIGM